MKKLILATLFAPCLISCGSSGSASHEVIKNDLRAPAYPLVTIDPYTSAWSPTDQLYESSVMHWTGIGFPFIGVLKVDGVPYRFMGLEEQEMKPIVPTSQQADWTGRWTTEKPAGDWTAENYDDSKWKTDRGAFGTMENEPTAKTQWGTREIWVRRTADITENLGDRPVYLEFSNDDDAIFYINGTQIYSTGPVCNKNKIIKLDDKARAALREGSNTLAAECINPVGNGLLDFGLLIPKEANRSFDRTADQTSVDVQATQTHYTFTCGDVNLALTFSAPMFTDDLELLSRPVNYVTYTVDSNDGKDHDVEIYFEASPRWALDQPYQASTSEAYEKDGLVYLKSGSKEQKTLAKRGDHVRIDWGHFYMAAPSENTTYGIGGADALRANFVKGEKLSDKTTGEDAEGQMALVCDLGEVKSATGKIMIGYDDNYSIQYFGENLRPYWNRDGSKTIESQFAAANAEYDKLIDRCYAFDKQLMEDATAAGGKKYAELCALAYRQTLAAHKLVESPSGEILMFSKENDSNGSIGTVDITYPSAPFFLYYNPELAKGLMNFIYEYSESGRWEKPFPAHDVGTYPQANGQTYGGDMPIEEGGNMIIITDAVCQQENSPEYAKKHWKTLTTWVDYLVEYGLDPENQLCTDDFAGHFAHNVNLSAKAIVAIAAYAKMAEMQGLTEVAEKYNKIARDYAAKWEEMANDGDHYRLTFDKEGTWSQKYNLVWDKLLGLNVFPKEIVDKEIAYYKTRQNKYGLPLDNRETYTKSDWIVWTATMAPDQESFETFITPLYSFYNETVDRVPMSDWVFTDNDHRRGFMARAVVGGYFIKMLEQKNANK